jgi:hypothetical protein
MGICNKKVEAMGNQDVVRLVLCRLEFDFMNFLLQEHEQNLNRFLLVLEMHNTILFKLVTLATLSLSFSTLMSHNLYHEFYGGNNIIVGVFFQVAKKFQT